MVIRDWYKSRIPTSSFIDQRSTLPAAAGRLDFIRGNTTQKRHYVPSMWFFCKFLLKTSYSTRPGGDFILGTLYMVLSTPCYFSSTAISCATKLSSGPKPIFFRIEKRVFSIVRALLLSTSASSLVDKLSRR